MQSLSCVILLINVCNIFVAEMLCIVNDIFRVDFDLFIVSPNLLCISIIYV